MSGTKSAFADGASLVTRLLSPDPEFDELVFRSLKPISVAMAVIFTVFVALGFIDDSAGDARPLIMVTDGAAALIYLAIFQLLRKGVLGVGATYWIGLVYTGLALGNALLAFWLTGQEFFLTYLSIVIIGISAFMLSLPWLLATIALILAVSFVVVVDVLPVATVLQYSPALVGSIPIAFLIFVTRRWHVIASQRALLAMQAEAEERKRAEGHLAHAQRLESIGKLSSGIAHDFNNLLMVIVGYTDSLLANADKDSELHEDLTEIRQAGEKAAALAQKLLAFSRQQVMQARVVEINELVQSARSLIVRSLPTNVLLELDLDPDVGRARIDPLQMEQVLINLALNARDAMADGGGTLTISTRCLRRGESDDAPPEDQVEIRVSDTGTGMSDEVRQRAFEPFFTTKQRGAGTGLGLAMVYGIVTQSGGRIDIESTPGAGTVFAVRLPRVEEAADALAPAREHDNRISLDGATVLVVDDEAKVREIVARTLARRDCKVLQADSGDEALRVAAREHFDLVLSDVVMPGMSGIELLAALRSRRYTQPALLMSGHAAENLADGVEIDVPLLNKPFRAQELVDAVNEALGNEATGQRHSA